jgi:hypothetical protein
VEVAVRAPGDEFARCAQSGGLSCRRVKEAVRLAELGQEPFHDPDVGKQVWQPDDQWVADWRILQEKAAVQRLHRPPDPAQELATGRAELAAAGLPGAF